MVIFLCTLFHVICTIDVKGIIIYFLCEIYHTLHTHICDNGSTDTAGSVCFIPISKRKKICFPVICALSSGFFKWGGLQCSLMMKIEWIVNIKFIRSFISCQICYRKEQYSVVMSQQQSIVVSTW